MRHFMAILGLALAACAICPDAGRAQVVIVGRPVYSAPVVVSQSYYPPVVTYSSPAPVVTYSAPPVVTYSSPAPVVTYSPPPVVTYSAPVVTYSAPVVTYSAPAPVVTYAAPAPGTYTTRTYHGFGIFRPRGTYTETTYQP